MTRLPRPLAVPIAVAALALAVPAQGVAATPLERKVATLTRQMTTLQKQVKTLQTQIRTLSGALGANFAGDTCHAAITADVIQGTWVAIDQRFDPDIFGAQQAVSDFNNCGLLQQPTVARPGIVSPPSIAAFNPLLNWLHFEP